MSVTPDNLERRGRPSILFLHGFMGCGEDWVEVCDLLGNGYFHTRVDIPGHGGSSDIRDAAFGDVADLMSNVAKLRGAPVTHLVGYSMGARLALYIAVHHADKLDRIVIESGSPGLKTERERKERRLRDHRLADTLRTQDFGEFLESWYNQPLFASMDKSSERFRQLLARRRIGDPHACADSLEQLGTGVQPSLWENLCEIQNPVLFVAGEKDHKFTRLAAEMSDLCPNGQLAIIASAGHNVHFEQPELYAKTVADFLGE